MGDKRIDKEQIFNQAAEIGDPAQRAAFLDQACRGDERLRAEVEELLRHDAAAGSFLEHPPLEALLPEAAAPGQDAQQATPANQPSLDSPGGVGADKASGVPDPAETRPGTRLRYVGDYELLEEIGRGGMGVVYKARQVSLNRTVAVKMISAGQLASQADIERFRSEAQAAGQLRHPQIVAIHEVGEHQGQHYFSMDYIDGPNLAEVLRAGPWPPRQAARLVKTLAEAVHHAHQQGILHRDLKPSNVLLSRPERPVGAAGGTGNQERAERAENQQPPASARPASDRTPSDEKTAAGAGAANTAAPPRTERTSPFPRWPDIGPSPHITDFGLAKRLAPPAEGKSPGSGPAAASRTATGQVLGTPSYMAPEQAAGAKRGALGPPTDVYALGAILYEMLVGRPPFQAATPLETILQVLHDDPAPPRQLNRSVPRDLETICLKCLEKEPRQRYQTAQELAEDLGRFLADELIRARRVGPAGRAVRWLRRQRRSVALTAATAAVIVVAALVGWTAWSLYELAHRGFVSFQANTLPVYATIIDASTEKILQRIALPTAEPVAIRSGDYQVRIEAPRQLSQTYQLRVRPCRRHEAQQYTLALENRTMWQGIEVGGRWELCPDGSKTDVIDIALPDRIRRFSGRTGQLLWELSFKDLPADDIPGASGVPWKFERHCCSYQHCCQRGHPGLPELVLPGPDLNGDAQPDLIVPFRHVAALLAVCGVSGKVLWCFDGRTRPEMPALRQAGTVVGRPVAAHVDGDSVPDIVAVFADAVRSQAAPQDSSGDLVSQSWASVRRWVQAVSGNSGRAIWRFPIPESWFDLRGGVPEESRWFLEEEGMTMSVGGDRHQKIMGQWLPAPQPAQLLRTATGENVVGAAGRHVVLLDVAAGKPQGSEFDLGFWPIRAPQLVDVDGDGADELLAIREKQRPAPERAVLELVAWRLPTFERLWSAEFRALWRRYDLNLAIPWPQAADLDGDGAPEVVVPDSDASARGVAVLDGRTGELRWRWAEAAFQVDHFTTADDSDGDGVMDLVVQWFDKEGGILFGPRGRIETPLNNLTVTCLSGRSGRRLWQWREAVRWDDTGGTQGPLRAWSPGPQAPPLLITSYREPYKHDVVPGTTTFMLDSRTGQLVHVLRGVFNPILADANGDGVDDLLCAAKPITNDGADGAAPVTELFAMRGAPRAAWRRLIHATLSDDLDGDEVRDLIESPSDEKPVTALSGADGKILWQSRVCWSQYVGLNPVNVATAGSGFDLDRDARPDLIVFAKHGHDWGARIVAVSGQSGAQIWQAAIDDMFRIRQLRCLTPKAQAAASIYVIYQRNGFTQALLGTDGRLIWKRPLSSDPALGEGRNYGVHTRWPVSLVPDLDGDRVTHLLVSSVDANRTAVLLSLRAADGAELWSYPLSARGSNAPRNTIGSLPQAAVGDLDGNGALEVAVLDYVRASNKSGQADHHAHLIVLDGATGNERWTKRLPYDFGAAHPDDQPERLRNRPRPLVVRAGENASGIAVWNWTEDRIYLFDAMGSVIWQQGLTAPDAEHWRLWACDTNADGVDELLYFDRGRLIAVSAETGKPLWEAALPAGPRAILETRTVGNAAQIIVRAGSRACALDGRTGRAVWQTEGPGEPLGLLNSPDSPAEPLVAFQTSGGQLVCQPAHTLRPNNH